MSATVWLAAAAGIRVMGTGGIGGVHRGYSETLDESADLQVLSTTRVAVVSAGVKSILDVPATLERQRLTPHLLSSLVRATGGASLEANLAAVRGNVRLASEIAVAFSAVAEG